MEFFGGTARVTIEDGVNGKFALKTLTKPELKRRFQREVKYQRQFNHPNIVKIFNFDLDADPPWFIMPVAECNFRAYLNNLVSQDRIRFAIPILHNILDGLQEIHSVRKYHRDLKPENVLIFKSDFGQFGAISDFGLVGGKVDYQTTKLTFTGTTAGTEAYMAPECAKDFENADHRADIFAFGCILHDVFVNTWRAPYTTLTADGLIGAVIRRCTQISPELRYQSVFDLQVEFILATDHNEQERQIFSLPNLAKLIDTPSGLNLNPLVPQIGKIISDDLFDWDFLNLLTNQPVVELLVDHSPAYFQQMASYYVHCITNHQFSFGYTDRLSDRAMSIFGVSEDEDLKADIAAGVFKLGYYHNRFHVYDVFSKMAGPNISDGLALKIRHAIERYSLSKEIVLSVLSDKSIHPLAIPVK